MKRDSAIAASFSTCTDPDWHGFDAVMGFGILSVFLVTGLLWRTGWGLALRATGEYPQAAEAAGFGVHRLRYQAAAMWPDCWEDSEARIYL